MKTQLQNTLLLHTQQSLYIITLKNLVASYNSALYMALQLDGNELTEELTEKLEQIAKLSNDAKEAEAVVDAAAEKVSDGYKRLFKDSVNKGVVQ